MILTSCATIPEYQKKNANGVRTGYTDFKIAKDTYRIKYEDVSEERAFKGLIRRGREIAMSSDMSLFCLSDMNMTSQPLVIEMLYGQRTNRSMYTHTAIMKLSNTNTGNCYSKNYGGNNEN